MEIGKLLSRVLVLILGISFAFINTSALAHDTESEKSHAMPKTTAEEAKDGGRAEMVNFALHARAHLEAIPEGNLLSFSKFRKETRGEGEVFKSGDTYMIVIDRSSRQIMFHGKYNDAAGKNPLNLSDDSETPKLVVREILDGVEKGGVPYCVEYKRGTKNRWACGVQFTYKLFGPPERSLFADALVIVGFDHEKDFLEECKPDVLASEVKDKESLRKFVEGAAVCIGTTRLPITDRHLARREPGPWKSGEIYLFVMVEEDEVVLFNGLNAGLEDTTLNLADKNGCNVGEGIIDVLNSRSNENCKTTPVDVEKEGYKFLESGGFVEYLWNRPGHPEYDDKDFNPVEGEISPGIAPKIGYVVRINTEHSRIALPYKLIVGSGIYPEETAESVNVNSDDGCAIAGIGNNSKDTVFNLFLIVSGMVLAIFWKRRTNSRAKD